MNMRNLLLSLLLLGVLPVCAQGEKSPEDGFRWKLIGRVFFDGGVFMNDTLDFGHAFHVNDIRLGSVVTIGKGWDAKIELGYGNGKVSMKDVYLGYALGEHRFRLGYQYEPFGNARVGTANYRFMQNATADNVFGDSRKLGISYSYDHEWMNIMAGVFSGGDMQGNVKMDQGYSLAAKFIGRPWTGERKLLHLAVAPRFSSGQETATFNGGVPTMLLNKSENGFADATLDGVINQWKLDLECIMIYRKWMLQGQYLFSHLNRREEENFNGQGGYVQASFLILGGGPNYNRQTGMLGNPEKGSLELLARYDCVDLNNGDVLGGKLSDITVGMNYFINKYIAAKINYTRMMPGESSPLGGKGFDLLQARVQFNF